jgi:hypothetical protein
VELQHRKIKAQWFRTNMREAIPQMVRIGDVGDALDVIKERLEKLEAQGSKSLASGEITNAVKADNSSPYSIGQSDRAEDSIIIPLWVHIDHANDPAFKVCPYSSGP